jgi:hypothetical protein
MTRHRVRLVLMILSMCSAVAGPALAGINNQPDGLIAKPGDFFIGNNIYNTSGAGQSVTRTKEPGVFARYLIQFQNDGPDSSDSQTVDGCSPNGSQWAAKYYDISGNDISKAVKAGTYVTPTAIPVGSSYQITLEMKIKPDGGPDQILCYTRATSNTSSSGDTVEAKLLKK